MIHSLCLTPDGRTLCVFSASNALRIYDVPTVASASPVNPTRVIARAHDAPVHVCRTDPTGTYLAAGGADGTVKVIDVARGHATHILRGHGGVVSALTFSYPPAVGLGERVMRLITASVDTRVRVWDLARGAVLAKAGKAAKPEAVLEGHVSVPRGLDVSADGRWLVTGGRDGVALLWDLEGGKKSKGKGKEGEGMTPVLVNTLTALERVEAVGVLEEEQEVAGVAGAGQLRVYTAGEKGIVRVWDAKKGSVLCTLGEEREPAGEDQEEQRQILDAMFVCLYLISVQALTTIQICPIDFHHPHNTCRPESAVPFPLVRHSKSSACRLQRRNHRRRFSFTHTRSHSSPERVL